MKIIFNSFFIQSQDEEQTTISVPVFRWIALHNLTSLDHCRNSKQGHTLIADELGTISLHGT